VSKKYVSKFLLSIHFVHTPKQTAGQAKALSSRPARLFFRSSFRSFVCCQPCEHDILQELSYRKQIARQLRTQYVEGIYDNPITLTSRLRVTQGHLKRKLWIDHSRLTISRAIWRWILSWPKCGLEVTQGHWKWYHLKAWLRFPIRLPL